jgi:hypothetical protein
MDSLADRITAELSVLVGQPLGDGWRAADMQVFEFGPRRQIPNRSGGLVEVGAFAIHLQCRWRFVDGRSILFGRDDLSRPADESTPAEQFDASRGESALDVARRSWFDRHRPSPPVVLEARGDTYGGFRIALAGGYALECLPCDSRRGEYAEHWRLLGHRPDGSHFVVTGDGVEPDDPLEDR